ncbi:LysE/ArgO family amino acid transporter [Paucibacter sp. Y2R2-4]|uniref:LysE/ArgO family amino acid transporter n=1 Tax=Paucibacter sp. Y2R2-4 TaxID=2893553 RepID=UPI0021E472D9|nr:LysE/ArgO family amino acid transporter [Paucibacter sp. Y2R2-4]MCV2350262.1 LysE/ArgO family amino acid transporter [Paucibacter sp. Y2R2-4]
MKDAFSLLNEAPSYLHGLSLGLSLIMAIGAQNAFVLRQGLRREHVLLIVLCCAMADAVLMAAGVYGLAALIGERRWLAQGLTAGGAAFLAIYGLQALRRAAQSGSLQPGQDSAQQSRRQVLLQLAGFTLLNPHVYLDTVLLVGSIGAQHVGTAKLAFVIGAASGSVLWFAGLGFGARWLAPVFAKPRAWQVLDVLIGLTMLGLAALLLRQLLA